MFVLKQFIFNRLCYSLHDSVAMNYELIWPSGQLIKCNQAVVVTDVILYHHH